MSDTAWIDKLKTARVEVNINNGVSHPINFPERTGGRLMSALQTLKRTQPAPSPHAIRGQKPRRKAKPLASQPSKKPRKQPNMQRRKAKPRVVRKPQDEDIRKGIINFPSHEKEKLDVRVADENDDLEAIA